MNHFAIVREEDEDFIIPEDHEYWIRLDGGGSISLSDIPPNFIEWGERKPTIKFVGMCTIRQNNEYTTIYSLPKYFPKDKCTSEHIAEVQSHIKKICKVIEKLKSELKSTYVEGFLFNPYEQNDNKQSVNRFELAEFIIEDYLQYGLYVKDYTETRKGGIGRVHWGRTVAKIQPIIQGNDPVYLDLMKKHHMIDENDLISVIHANVLNQCLDFIGPLISNGIEHIDTEPLGEDLSRYSSTINARSTYVFIEREINLFKALEAWCTCTQFYKNYAGVTCFYRVWELVNDFVWGNIEHPESKNPIYHISEKNYSGTGEAIPDTIRIEKQEEKTEVFIYDSKYYTIKAINPKDDKISGLPSNSDIVKQVAYLKLIKSQYSANSFFNSFLLPESYEGCREEEKEAFQIPVEKWFTTIGYVNPGAFNLELDRGNDDNDEDKVGLIFVNPSKLYDIYLKGSSVTHEEVYQTTNYLKCS